MKRRNRNIIAVIVVTLSSGWIAGCNTDFIAGEAQRAFASFLTGIVTTAINETVAPN